MATKPQCPQCRSTKTMAVPDSGVFLCYDCKHEFVPEKVVQSMRLRAAGAAGVALWSLDIQDVPQEKEAIPWNAVV